MKKLILVLAIVTLSLGGMAGCTKKSFEITQSISPDSHGSYVLRTYIKKSNIWGNLSRGETYYRDMKFNIKLRDLLNEKGKAWKKAKAVKQIIIYAQINIKEVGE